MTRTSRWWSLLLLCLLPYLQAKLEATLARQRDEEDFSIRLAQTRSQRLYRAAVAAYPYVSSAWQTWIFCQQLLFVFGVSRTHSPLLWLAGVRLERLNTQDIRDMEWKARTPGRPAGGRYSSQTPCCLCFYPQWCPKRCALYPDRSPVADSKLKEVFHAACLTLCCWYNVPCIKVHLVSDVKTTKLLCPYGPSLSAGMAQIQHIRKQMFFTENIQTVRLISLCLAKGLSTLNTYQV